MGSTTLPTYIDSENDDANEESASQPLLLQSTSPTLPEANCSTTTIKLPTSVHPHKSNVAKNISENRIINKLGHLVNIRFNRNEYNRRSHRDRWSRINIGLFTISFFSVVYLCVSLNLNVDKPSPQVIVDVPPIDVNLLGPKGNS